MPEWVEWVGWVATLVFAISYFFRDPKRLRWIQALAALLWIAYGISIHARPVIVSNVIVATAAVYSSFRKTQGNSSGTLKSDAA